MEKELKKKVKKLVKTNSLRLMGIKHAKEYLALNDKIEKMVFIIVPKSTLSFYEKIENQCIDGLYKQHLAITMEPRMKNFYNEFNYEDLIDKYDNKIQNFKKNTEYVIETRSKKQMEYEEKSRIIDMLSRQFASNDYSKIGIIGPANFTKRNVEKLYKSTKNILEEITQNVQANDNIKNNYLDTLKINLTKYWNEKEGLQEEVKIDVKQKFKLWEWVKQFFKIKKKLKMLEAPKQEDN